MSDLEITRQCAEAIGLATVPPPKGYENLIIVAGTAMPYNPLRDDAQAMALVKRFGLDIQRYDGWCVRKSDGHGGGEWYCEDDLNRAIVEYVSKMQAAK